MRSILFIFAAPRQLSGCAGLIREPRELAESRWTRRPRSSWRRPSLRRIASTVPSVPHDVGTREELRGIDQAVPRVVQSLQLSRAGREIERHAELGVVLVGGS